MATSKTEETTKKKEGGRKRGAGEEAPFDGIDRLRTVVPSRRRRSGPSNNLSVVESGSGVPRSQTSQCFRGPLKIHAIYNSGRHPTFPKSLYGGIRAYRI